MSYFYLSFATDAGFLGATVVEARDAEDAIAVATALGLNPGGEAAIFEVPPEALDEPDLKALIGRLASREEMIAQGGQRLGDLPGDIQDDIRAVAARVCADCNPTAEGGAA